MKNTITKSPANYMCLFALVLTIASCTNAKKEPDSEKVAEEYNDAKFDNSKEKDADFLVEAASINMAEIEMSQLAQSKAMAADVKNLANKMVEEHTKSLNELKALASKKMITLPSSLTENNQEDYNNLTERSGNDFDKKYCQMMVDGHKDAIREFEKASNDASDSEIRDWASNTLPTLRSHLDQTMVCNDKYK
jgi:putative membrane protein